ncbi:MAG: hypothetical protein CM1200mP30_07000 [Pseudomonadota bacterium]|nr:MAG: hypothetical protein CM1200mP30_07000 [Pseudomonadota bacterium]
MDLINLAHGSLYMMGAYFSATFTNWTESFFLGVLLTLPACMLFGILLEIIALRTLYTRSHLDQVLATFGLIPFFLKNLYVYYGALSGSISLFRTIKRQRRTNFWHKISCISYINYCCRNHSSPFTLLTRIPTKLGMLIRAGASNRQMESALGVNINLLYTIVLVWVLRLQVWRLNGSPNMTVEIGMGEGF